MITICQEIKDYLYRNLSENRYSHTISVEKECQRLAELFSLSSEDKDILCRAALLHDITKEKTPDEQIELCRVYNINYTKEKIATPSLFHAVTGAKFAKERFPLFCTDEVSEIIRTHTTGAENMTLLQKLLFLADTIEETRRHKSCVELRNYFWSAAHDQDPYILLDNTLVKSLDMTVQFLLNSGMVIDIETVKARNYLLMYHEVKK